ncbi:hypothetical protein LCGC14_0783460 [marine sediment metagenome]|uniref:Uncharacterized protein n=1 Tax=marine sediment metagenome TaxID=412755 RepID=A0A0F9T1T9_9ZZZZ
MKKLGKTQKKEIAERSDINPQVSYHRPRQSGRKFVLSEAYSMLEGSWEPPNNSWPVWKKLLFGVTSLGIAGVTIGGVLSQIEMSRLCDSNIGDYMLTASLCILFPIFGIAMIMVIKLSIDRM